MKIRIGKEKSVRESMKKALVPLVSCMLAACVTPVDSGKATTMTPVAPVPAVAVAPAPVVTPSAADPNHVVTGSKVYARLCLRCHGPDLVASAPGTFDLRAFPLDQKTRFVDSVLNGKNAMPPWKEVLQPGEMEALWDYVRAGGKK